MHTRLANLNHYEVNFLSCAAVKLSLYYYTYSMVCLEQGVQHNCITGPKFSSPFLKGPHNSSLGNN